MVEATCDLTWFLDQDGDGFGDSLDSVSSCEVIEGRVLVSGDCDDTDDEIYPGATETPNDGVDSDCDGTPEQQDTESPKDTDTASFPELTPTDPGGCSCQSNPTGFALTIWGVGLGLLLLRRRERPL